MGKDQGFMKIGPYSKKGLFAGIVLGLVVLILSLLVITYTDQLFIVSILWLIAIPFILWILKKARKSKDPVGERRDQDGS